MAVGWSRGADRCLRSLNFIGARLLLGRWGVGETFIITPGGKWVGWTEVERGWWLRSCRDGAQPMLYPPQRIGRCNRAKSARAAWLPGIAGSGWPGLCAAPEAQRFGLRGRECGLRFARGWRLLWTRLGIVGGWAGGISRERDCVPEFASSADLASRSRN